MKYFLFVIFPLVYGARAVWAWPEGQPNCGVAGNWTDPEGEERMAVSVKDVLGHGRTFSVEFNSSKSVYCGLAPYDDPRTTTVRVVSNGTGPDGTDDALSLTLVCSNNVLWVMQTPLHSSPRMMRVLTMRRRVAPLPRPVSDTPTVSTPQYILVNITLPKHQEDDHLPRGDDLPLSDAQTLDKRAAGSRQPVGDTVPAGGILPIANLPHGKRRRNG